MARQIPLDLEIPPALGRDDFLVTADLAPAVDLLERPADWPQGRLLVVGPAGAGKTHIANFWAAEHLALQVHAGALRPADAGELLPAEGAVVVEDVEQAAGCAEAEQGLFHLWNLAAARRGLLLMTARGVPRDWGLGLADLRSRMDAVAQLRLGPPDDALLAAVLVKMFADRQIEVAPGLVEALVRRMDRDLGLARRLVAAVDRTALAEGRAVTRRLALDTLARLMAAGEEAGS